MKLIRIKKDIDLRILEKYGFSPCGRKDRPDYVKKIRTDYVPKHIREFSFKEKNKLSREASSARS